MPSNRKAVIKYQNGNKRTVYLQQEIGGSGGSFWATNGPANSNSGWSLYRDGLVVREQYDSRSNERLSSQRLVGATWKAVA